MWRSNYHCPLVCPEFVVVLRKPGFHSFILVLKIQSHCIAHTCLRLQGPSHPPEYRHWQRMRPHAWRKLGFWALWRAVVFSIPLKEVHCFLDRVLSHPHWAVWRLCWIIFQGCATLSQMNTSDQNALPKDGLLLWLRPGQGHCFCGALDHRAFHLCLGTWNHIRNF